MAESFCLAFANCGGEEGNKNTSPPPSISPTISERIADKLQSLGYVEDDNEESKETLSPSPNNVAAGEIFIPLPNQLPKYRVGHTIDPSWNTPESPLPEYRERENGERREGVPTTLAELTIPREELRRLRAIGIERKTGGLVIWRSGSNKILYRGTNYKYPYFLSDTNSTNDTSAYTSPSSSVDCDIHFREESLSSSTDAVNSTVTNSSNKVAQPRLIQDVGSPNRVRFQLPGEAQLADEADRLLDGLGPQFTGWWGYDPLPVDADILPAVVPGYRKPFHLLPYGVKPILTNDELTILKRLGRPLPCHFELGRNRKLQGLAATIVKLWAKCEISRIAVKRGVQNTRSELMTEELKDFVFVISGLMGREDVRVDRGKDFLLAAVSSAIKGRRKFAIPIQKHKTGYSSLVMTRQESEHGNAMDEKARAENLLAELEMEETSQESKIGKVGITEEERCMLRKRFKGTAQTLEAESGGILVVVERVSKGYAILVYRGKNYKRPCLLETSDTPNQKTGNEVLFRGAAP
ncbi:CRM family member 2 [Actinidia rufa]|uniref:CRM family member 2 n=1 Tax=Actinidia rufa TaxID=165716 RepID=A0A7J0DY18_9ERIC|nr:CRM family member 2 [Actinidia rufa]